MRIVGCLVDPKSAAANKVHHPLLVKIKLLSILNTVRQCFKNCSRFVRQFYAVDRCRSRLQLTFDYSSYKRSTWKLHSVAFLPSLLFH